VLLGEAGVGKTAIVEGLAQKIIAGNVPDILHDRSASSPSTWR
jgi:ATP-dependent Clp protease ATP-binding subunit ClpA